MCSIYFSPTIIKTLGFNTAQVQLFSTSTYAFAFTLRSQS